MRHVSSLLAIAALCVSSASAHSQQRRTAVASFKVSVTVVRKCTMTTQSSARAVGGAGRSGATVSVGCSARTPYAITVSSPQLRNASALGGIAHGRGQKAADAAALGDPVTVAVTY